jgi:hypothetical protein
MDIVGYDAMPIRKRRSFVPIRFCGFFPSVGQVLIPISLRSRINLGIVINLDGQRRLPLPANIFAEWVF